MPTLVATGQITIADQNDARPIYAYITASPSKQQVFTKDESTVLYTPSWITANSNAGLILTVKVYAGSVSAAVDVTGQLTNRQFATTPGGTAITGTAAVVSTNASLNALFLGTGTFTTVHNAGGSTLTIKDNLRDTVGSGSIFFDGDYTDPVTSLVIHVSAQIDLSVVKTGTNAVYILTRGSTAIEQATGSTKNAIAVGADLIRAAGVDTSGVTYKWYENNGSTFIWNTAPFTTEYGLKTTSAGTLPTASNAEIGVNLPATGAWSAHNTLVIHETAVNDMGTYKVEARDADTTVFQSYFVITDVSDPYQVNILSSSGDKLQNGVGSTDLTPDVFYGANRVTPLTGWSFTWTLYDRAGNRVAFIDTTRTAVAGGRDITANTAGASGVFTYSGANITFAAGDIIKVVTAAGDTRFYEVASGTGATVTIRTPTTNAAFLSYTTFPAPTASQFVGGKMFVCVGSLGQRTTSAAASVTVTGDEIDAKGRIAVDANRP